MALKHFEGVEIRVIGQGMQKYLTLSLGKYLVFKDILQFLGSILATLAKNHVKTGLESFKHLSRKFIATEAREFRRLLRKWVYPYDYMDRWEKLDEQQLPTKEAFHSKLSYSDISDEDYEHAQNVLRTFNIHTMRGYHNLYMMSMLHTFPTPILFSRLGSNNMECITH